MELYDDDQPVGKLLSRREMLAFLGSAGAVAIVGTGGRVGGGAPPVLIDAGWLSIYHTTDQQNRDCLGAFIADKSDPARIVKLYDEPVFVPEATYETNGFFGKVVFTCGAVQRGSRLPVYYGAADEHIALATVDLNVFAK